MGERGKERDNVCACACVSMYVFEQEHIFLLHSQYLKHKNAYSCVNKFVMCVMHLCAINMFNMHVYSS